MSQEPVTTLRCPFCGEEPEGLCQPEYGGTRWAMLCVMCGATGPLHEHGGDAFDLWNRRATDGVPVPYPFKEWSGGGPVRPYCGNCGRTRNDPLHAPGVGSSAGEVQPLKAPDEGKER